MSAAKKFIPTYTVEDYEQWEGDWELWDGHPVAMAPAPSFDHQSFAGDLYRMLYAAVSESGCEDCYVVYEFDWRVSNQTVYRPDISVVCGKRPGKFIADTPSLLVEVLSPSTATKDKKEKMQRYGEKGVKWYLIGDPETRTVDVFRLSRGRLSKFKHSGTPTIQLSGDCSIELALESLVKRK